MHETTELRLVAFLDEVERERRENGDALHKIQATVTANSETLDGLADELAEVKGEVIAQSSRIGSIEDRLEGVETSADEAVEATGRHELQRVQDQLEQAQTELVQRRESARHWVRYLVATVVGLLIMAGSGLLGYLLKGG